MVDNQTNMSDSKLLTVTLFEGLFEVSFPYLVLANCFIQITTTSDLGFFLRDLVTTSEL